MPLPVDPVTTTCLIVISVELCDLTLLFRSSISAESTIANLHYIPLGEHAPFAGRFLMVPKVGIDSDAHHWI